MQALTTKAQEILDAYELTHSAKSPTTRLLYRYVVTTFLGEVGAPPWTPQAVLLHLNKLADRNAETSVATKAQIIRSFLKWAASRGHCDTMLADCAVTRKPAKRTPRTASADEIGELFSYVNRPRTKLALLLATSLGLRESEIRGLRWVDVDLERETVSVLGKGNKRRELPICDEELLAELRKQQGETMQYLVPGQGGKQLTKGALGKTMKRLCAAAGIRTLNPHALRHAFAATHAISGVSSAVLSKMLGHSNLATTERYLTDLTNVESLRAGMTRPKQGTAVAAVGG